MAIYEGTTRRDEEHVGIYSGTNFMRTWYHTQGITLITTSTTLAPPTDDAYKAQNTTPKLKANSPLATFQPKNDSPTRPDASDECDVTLALALALELTPTPVAVPTRTVAVVLVITVALALLLLPLATANEDVGACIGLPMGPPTAVPELELEPALEVTPTVVVAALTYTHSVAYPWYCLLAITCDVAAKTAEMPEIPVSDAT